MWPANTAFSPRSSPLGTFRQRPKRRVAYKQALLFGWAKQAVRERASERSREGPKKSSLCPAPAFASPLACLSRVHFSWYPSNGELARRLRGARRNPVFSLARAYKNIDCTFRGTPMSVVKISVFDFLARENKQKLYFRGYTLHPWMQCNSLFSFRIIKKN